jgi:hypothetical protein
MKCSCYARFVMVLHRWHNHRRSRSWELCVFCSLDIHFQMAFPESPGATMGMKENDLYPQLLEHSNAQADIGNQRNLDGPQ